MKHLTNKAREDFERRQAPTVRSIRYLGLPTGHDEAGKPTYAAKGLTDRAAHLLRNAMGQSTLVGANLVKIWDDPNLMDAAKVTRTATLAKTSIDNIGREYHAALETALDDLKALRRAVAKTYEPPTSAGQASIDGELRALLKGMKESERIAAVRSDPALMAAAARAPGVLSGLSDDFHKTVRREYAAKIDPDTVAKAEDLEASILTAEGAMQAIAEDLGSLTDFETAENLKAKSSADLTA
jgi:hypothetical protein